LSVYSLVYTTNFDRGDFRIIDGEKIRPRARRPRVYWVQCKTQVGDAEPGSTPGYFGFGEFDLLLRVFLALKLFLFA
jgi:hypothetical protein